MTSDSRHNGNGQKPFAVCVLKGEAIASVEDTWIVSDRNVPKDAGELKDLVRRKVCKDCAELIRKAGLDTFNLAQARQRAQQKARTTIGEILKSKNQLVEVSR